MKTINKIIGQNPKYLEIKQHPSKETLGQWKILQDKLENILNWTITTIEPIKICGVQLK